jgi:eukaryotic-like serine/threonine-protein kinase
VAVSKSQSIQVPVGFRDSEVPALRATEVVGSVYQVTELLGNTDTGAVYAARDMLLDRPVALKLAWRDPNAPRLLPEARQCSGVRGGPAVAVYALGNHHGVEYVVSERVDGERLAERLARGRLDDAQVVEIWRSIVAAVAACHAAGMAAGDVSRDSVQLAAARPGAPRVVLGRFSMSQVPATNRHGKIFAPEIARGTAGADDPMAAEAIDLYSLGAVALELAFGEPLFAHPELAVVQRAHAERPPPSLLDARPELPPELADLVDWLLVKDPDARPPSVTEVLTQLDTIVERDAASTPQLRVLIVDGDVARGRWLASLARRADAHAHVSSAHDGATASARIDQGSPDLLLIDSKLRGAMNALELSMYMRSLDGAARCRIAVLGEASPGDHAVLGRLGAAMVPFAPSAVLQLLRDAAAERRLAAPSRRPRRSSGPS